jgi:hypothetical protein
MNAITTNSTQTEIEQSPATWLEGSASCKAQCDRLRDDCFPQTKSDSQLINLIEIVVWN